jgi:hypothetical protein
LITRCGRAESSDPEFDEFNRKMQVLEGAIEKFIKDAKTFSDGVTSMYMCLLLPAGPSEIASAHPLEKLLN